MLKKVSLENWMIDNENAEERLANIRNYYLLGFSRWNWQIWAEDFTKWFIY